MGLYDTLQFEFSLPGRDVNHSFQTKSLGCTMVNYVVTIEGAIYKEDWEYIWTESETHPLKGYLVKIPETYSRTYLTDYHGDIIFYDDCFYCDYTARFSYGKLDNITFKTRERLNEKKLLHKCPATWEQNPCTRVQEWKQASTQSGLPTQFICKGADGNKI
jgi:hypothetical protein